MNLVELFHHTDWVGKAVALVLLTMSIVSWLFILWKAILFSGSQGRMAQAMAAFWNGANWAAAHTQLEVFDRRRWLAPLVQAAEQARSLEGEQTLLAQSAMQDRATRLIRHKLAEVIAQIQAGQTALATIGATAPFVGLLGTVWGIYHALISIGGEGVISMDKISAPVGEALIMTAIGLTVAIPAVLAYNFFAKKARQIQESLEGFAHDLRAFVVHEAARSRTQE